MKRTLAILPVLLLLAPAAGQDADTAAGGPNLLSETWQMDDAVTLPTGQVDLRFAFGWETAGFPANGGDSDDDFTFQPSLTWGTCNNVEVFVAVPVALGDGGDVGAIERGNADTTLGFTWRFAEPAGAGPAMALKASVRVPTGDNSSGVDGELRLIMTKDYDSGIRSHINAFARSVNGNNESGIDNSQFGFVAGMDGPLCSDGTVRWVADYMHRSRRHLGGTNTNMLELGWEWDMADAEKLGFSLQIGLDDNEDTPNFGAIITYSHSLTF